MTNDLISRQAAIEEIALHDCTNGTEPYFSGHEVIDILKCVPPVEPKRLPQPHKCVVYRDGSLCRHPIEACSECPKHEGMRAVLAERPKTTETMMIDGEPTEIDPLSYEVGYTHGQSERPKGE